MDYELKLNLPLESILDVCLWGNFRKKKNDLALVGLSSIVTRL